MYDDIKPQIRELVETQPKQYSNILRFQYPEFVQYLKDTYPSKGEGLYCWLYDIKQPPKCSHCRVVPCAFNSIHNGGYREFCSTSCRAKHNQSYKNAHSPNGSLKASAKAKIAAKGRESRKKARATYLKQHNVDMYDAIKQKREEAYALSVPPELRDRQFCADVKVPLMDVAIQLNVSYGMVLKHFRDHGLSTQNLKVPHSSGAETSICSYLDELGVQYVRSNRTLLPSRREIDIYVPSMNLGIEYCGLYWHSDRNQYPPNKHQEKFLEAASVGIKLITIFENEWLFKRDIVKSRLRSLVSQNDRVFARKCLVESADESQVKQLLDAWHIQGSKNNKNNITLSYNNETVAICTYGKPRYGDEDVEIIRYATKPGLTVVGGFSRLLKHVKLITGASTIVSFSDNRWGDGSVYAKSGMKKMAITKPSYFYFIPSERKLYHRTTFMKHVIVSKMGGNPDLSEVDNMRQFGYNRIFDCGTTKWILR